MTILKRQGGKLKCWYDQNNVLLLWSKHRESDQLFSFHKFITDQQLKTSNNTNKLILLQPYQYLKFKVSMKLKYHLRVHEGWDEMESICITSMLDSLSGFTCFDRKPLSATFEGGFKMGQPSRTTVTRSVFRWGLRKGCRRWNVTHVCGRRNIIEVDS